MCQHRKLGHSVGRVLAHQHFLSGSFAVSANPILLSVSVAAQRLGGPYGLVFGVLCPDTGLSAKRSGLDD